MGTPRRCVHRAVAHACHAITVHCTGALTHTQARTLALQGHSLLGRRRRFWSCVAGHKVEAPVGFRVSGPNTQHTCAYSLCHGCPDDNHWKLGSRTWGACLCVRLSTCRRRPSQISTTWTTTAAASSPTPHSMDPTPRALWRHSRALAARPLSSRCVGGGLCVKNGVLWGNE